ncbi:MAG: hypothetical protein JXB48_08210 [Candidatus Latescibacteria bacterium]|nr:hypothetical protein [Candidatus Latescibacterota bacterium]
MPPGEIEKIHPISDLPMEIIGIALFFGFFLVMGYGEMLLEKIFTSLGIEEGNAGLISSIIMWSIFIVGTLMFIMS